MQFLIFLIIISEKKKEKKPEKQLSLTERLRLEFGVDDCSEEKQKNGKQT